MPLIECDFCHLQFQDEDSIGREKIPPENRERFLTILQSRNSAVTWADNADGSLSVKMCLACEAAILPDNMRLD